jgi:hypothetical protein
MDNLDNYFLTHVHKFVLQDFCFLLLLLSFIVIVIILLLPTEKLVSGTTQSTYSSSAVAYAQQQQEQYATRTQGWIDKQSNTKVLFTYSPEKPSPGMLTELTFDIQDIETRAYFKHILATTTIIDGQQQQVPIKFSNISAPYGHFSIKYRFAHE